MPVSNPGNRRQTGLCLTDAVRFVVAAIATVKQMARHRSAPKKSWVMACFPTYMRRRLWPEWAVQVGRDVANEYVKRVEHLMIPSLGFDWREHLRLAQCTYE